jgi:hypothetical protein
MRGENILGNDKLSIQREYSAEEHNIPPAETKTIITVLDVYFG